MQPHLYSQTERLLMRLLTYVPYRSKLNRNRCKFAHVPRDREEDFCIRRVRRKLGTMSKVAGLAVHWTKNVNEAKFVIESNRPRLTLSSWRDMEVYVDGLHASESQTLF